MISKEKLIEFLQDTNIENIEIINVRDYNTENGYMEINGEQIPFEKEIYIKSMKEKIDSFKRYAMELEQKIKEMEKDENE